jgi:hypothetical protein
MTDGEAATADPVEAVEEDEARGYRGQADERDRDEYALTSGPESPSALESALEAKRAEVDAQLDELKEAAQAKGQSVRAAHTERKAARQTRKES